MLQLRTHSRGLLPWHSYRTFIAVQYMSGPHQALLCILSCQTSQEGVEALGRLCAAIRSRPVCRTSSLTTIPDSSSHDQQAPGMFPSCMSLSHRLWLIATGDEHAYTGMESKLMIILPWQQGSWLLGMLCSRNYQRQVKLSPVPVP